MSYRRVKNLMLQTPLKETRYDLFANAASGQYLMRTKKPFGEAGVEKSPITDRLAEIVLCTRTLAHGPVHT